MLTELGENCCIHEKIYKMFVAPEEAECVVGNVGTSF